MKETIVSVLKRITKEQWMMLGGLGLFLFCIAISKQGESTTLKTEQTSEKAMYEEQLEEMLSQVKEIGKVKVMLTMEEESSRSMWDTQATSEVSGVFVVAEGGENPWVVKQIQEAVMALFHVKVHKIKVMKMK